MSRYDLPQANGRDFVRVRKLKKISGHFIVPNYAILRSPGGGLLLQFFSLNRKTALMLTVKFPFL